MLGFMKSPGLKPVCFTAVKEDTNLKTLSCDKNQF